MELEAELLERVEVEQSAIQATQHLDTRLDAAQRGRLRDATRRLRGVLRGLRHGELAQAVWHWKRRSIRAGSSLRGRRLVRRALGRVARDAMVAPLWNWRKRTLDASEAASQQERVLRRLVRHASGKALSLALAGWYGNWRS